MSTRNPLLGHWRIVETELWPRRDLELLGPAVIDLLTEGVGFLRVGTLEAELNHRVRQGRGGWRADFSWEGLNDGEPVSGRGWVRMARGPLLRGKLFIHDGEESMFRALPDGGGKA